MWGNPYRIGRDGSRKIVVKRHRMLVKSWPHKTRELAKKLLTGKKLLCSCRLDEECHVDNLIDLCEGRI